VVRQDLLELPEQVVYLEPPEQAVRQDLLEHPVFPE
jgi:hypothetical protein